MNVYLCFAKGFNKRRWMRSRWGVREGGWSNSLMSMTLSTINFAESQWLNSIKRAIGARSLHHRTQKAVVKAKLWSAGLLYATTLKLHSSSIPPLQNYTRMCCVSQNQYILTCCSFVQLSMNRRAFISAAKRCLCYWCNADPILCEQRTGGKFREVEDDSRRTGRLFTIITG